MAWPIQPKFEIADRYQSMGLTRPYAFGTQSPTFRYAPGLFGPDTEHLKLPTCHSADLVLLLAERYNRSDTALQQWAGPAKKCVDFVEGRQYTAEQIAAADRDGRPHMMFNKIAPLVRLILGYHRNNRLDIRFLPSGDSRATQAVGETLTKVNKQISTLTGEPYVDTEVMMDGMITGRGYYDSRLDFEKNDFGDIGCAAKDPFTIRIDPDADTYDARQWGYFQEARWWSIEEVEYAFGRNAAALVYPLIGNKSYRGGQTSILEFQEEITPWRKFGGDVEANDLVTMEGFLTTSIDPYRKVVRVVETQWCVRVLQRCIVDLETGDREPVPDFMSSEQVAKLLAWSQERAMMRGSQSTLRVQWRPMRRVRWTVMCGDLVVYDDWSPYETYTITPYFPWFRRGQTRGMVDDLLGPQEEMNRRRNANIDIVERTAHSGWIYHERGLRETEKIKLQRYGAAAGINIEWRGSNEMKPEKIRPETPPTAMERLEERAVNDLKEIAGINDSALGQLDRVQSGRAIEARQRQSVLGIETYMDNNRRTKHMLGEKRLEMIQNHYTEHRTFQIASSGGKFDLFDVNTRLASGEIANNLNVGKYSVTIDDVPLSASFLSAQYEELVDMAEKGLLPLPLIQDIAVDVSSLPQKELLKQRLNALLKAQGMLTADELVAAMQSGMPVAPNAIPQGQPQPQPGASPNGGPAAGPQKKETPAAPADGGSEPMGQPAAAPALASPQGMY